MKKLGQTLWDHLGVERAIFVALAVVLCFSFLVNVLVLVPSI